MKTLRISDYWSPYINNITLYDGDYVKRVYIEVRIHYTTYVLYQTENNNGVLLQLQNGVRVIIYSILSFDFKSRRPRVVGDFEIKFIHELLLLLAES